MSAATPLPWQEPGVTERAKTNFCAVFEHAPVAVARCSPQGEILEMNPAFTRSLKDDAAVKRGTLFAELACQQDREKIEFLFCQLRNFERESVSIQENCSPDGRSGASWTAWRLPDSASESEFDVLVARLTSDSEVGGGKSDLPTEESFVQAQRWEAVGRLTGGVVHDFNNLLTGVMLYCDLLLSSLDHQDRRRRYADEIRGAIIQASGLVQQLLVFARPQAMQLRSLCLNQIASSMQDLLARLIGEHITLDLRLDPQLGTVKIDPAQAQQILLNLVLNARDALTEGGHITVQTSNCKFQPLDDQARSAGDFPCVLLVVADNGRGMDAKTRERLFEPFFTTKGSGKGTGLGLTTVRSIVTANRGLIHLESEPGHGTRVMILLPRTSTTTDQDSADHDSADTEFADPGSSITPILDPPSSHSSSPFQEIKKESIL
jgi:two-component system, cell cycle sensor histidine kinase and response regulator CckA